MSALSAIEAGAVDEISMPGREVAADGEAKLGRPDLHLVRGPSGPGHGLPGARRPGGTQHAEPPGPGHGLPGARRPGGAQHAAPLRLTRRGRIVLAVLTVVLATVVITVIGMAAAGGAQATNHGKAGAGYQGMRQIVVQPGQTLWSIAAKVEPAADPRLVIAQIMTANSLTSTVVQAGELIWVPR
jgi:hypothetical protein